MKCAAENLKSSLATCSVAESIGARALPAAAAQKTCGGAALH
jgi:hypothetical protein